MRTLPHSVVVLTTCTSPAVSTTTQGSNTSGSKYRGMALSSFTTLTLTPSPIITFNIRQPSRTLDALRESKHFLIHILEASKAGSKVAHGFAQGGGGVDGFKKSNIIEEHVILKEMEGLVLPRLNGDGVMQALRCEVLRNDDGECKGMIRVGDHMLVLAEVTEILGDDPMAENSWHGLCYADGRYRLIGDTIEVDRLDDLTVQ
ncbi:uncharacterized protein BP5553_00747 [Venustampulla echinocandica]|uniref:Flavin reductase like domain-containing protein n=1 Tax=Venustampulla echinocandica TaxID=2656787 RepID=A0A370TZ44_9HELO|nr:uncharacterized protein BP5553_00747 [Venustampulla echinocandica]RDL40768.1 hypothetical protein BP5553_00747 [Venustampulla echinocandica]